jgi:hypothetical protein
MVEKMMGCRNPQCGYARYVCPKCYEKRIVLSFRVTILSLGHHRGLRADYYFLDIKANAALIEAGANVAGSL